VSAVLAGVRVDEGIGTCIGEAQPIIQLPIGEQPPIRDDYGAAKLDGSAACARQVKSEGR
jgi:hypothetical protein